MSTIIQETPKGLNDNEQLKFFEIDLATALSRLAALQGESVPKNRFLFSSIKTHANFLEDYPAKLQAREIWLTLFPFGTFQELNQSVDKTNLPALWFSGNGIDIKIIKGVLSNESYAVESPEGKEDILDVADFKKGDVIRLSPGVNESSGLKSPKTAWDWFFYAIKKRRLSFIESIVASAVTSVLALGISFYTMQVYDRVVSSQSYSTLIVITIGVWQAKLQ